MKEDITKNKKDILVVVRWPLGGIRTYLLYMFCHFPSNYELTILATSTHENDALKNDTRKYGAKLKLVQRNDTPTFILQIFKELKQNKYDLIISQGFMSMVAVCLVNIMFRIPHILTIHGVMEPKYLSGRLGLVKRFLFGLCLARVTLFYAVSNDMLAHLYDQFPKLQHDGPPSIIIPNGIEPEMFAELPNPLANLREKLGVDEGTFLFGFFGRFMPQKGFDLLIEAVHDIRQQGVDIDFAIIAVGSGDYVREYRNQIRTMGLDSYFYFLPFQQKVYHLYTYIDAIVMPSRWEASGLLAMEALSAGTPLIASDCIGLRETVENTPTFVFISEDVKDLSHMMRDCLESLDAEVFRKFKVSALIQFDVARSAEKLVQIIETMQEHN